METPLPLLKNTTWLIIRYDLLFNSSLVLSLINVSPTIFHIRIEKRAIVHVSLLGLL